MSELNSYLTDPQYTCGLIFIKLSVFYSSHMHVHCYSLMSISQNRNKYSMPFFWVIVSVATVCCIFSVITWLWVLSICTITILCIHKTITQIHFGLAVCWLGLGKFKKYSPKIKIPEINNNKRMPPSDLTITRPKILIKKFVKKFWLSNPSTIKDHVLLPWVQPLLKQIL